MESGEEYLNVQLFGNKNLNIAAFKNKEKKNEKEPDYRGNGIAIWLNKKK